MDDWQEMDCAPLDGSSLDLRILTDTNYPGETIRECKWVRDGDEWFGMVGMGWAYLDPATSKPSKVPGKITHWKLSG